MKNPSKIPLVSMMMCCAPTDAVHHRQRRPLYGRRSMKRRRLSFACVLSTAVGLLLAFLETSQQVRAFQPSLPNSRHALPPRLPANHYYARDYPRAVHYGAFHQSRIRLFVSSTNDTATSSPRGWEKEQQQQDQVLIPSDSLVSNNNGNTAPLNGAIPTNQTAPLNGGATSTCRTCSSSDIPMPTENGGYSHTSASRAKISAANKGKVPWNKGKSRSPEERARIAAGVRAKNRQRFLEKLQQLGMTEEEYKEEKKRERRQKDQERRARKTTKGGYRPTEETKQKISAILKEKWAKGEMKKRTANPAKVRRGFTHSAETRAKISASLKKRWANDAEYRDQMTQKTTSSNASDDVKRRISESLKKKWQDPVFRQEMMQKMAARRQPTGPHGLSHREKISAAMKRKWQEEEYRNKTIAGIQKNRGQQQSSTTTQRRKSTTTSKPRPKKKATPKAVTAVDDGIRVARPVQPKQTKVVKKKKKPAVKRSPAAAAVSKSAAPRVVKKKPPPKKRVPAAESTTPKEKSNPSTAKTAASTANALKEKKAALAAEPDGSITRLREERRDLYDLLYGEDGSSSSPLDLGDENLDTFDPYGLEDF